MAVLLVVIRKKASLCYIYFQQFATEEVNEDTFTFEDLGILPANLNEAAISILRRHRTYYYHDQILKEEEFCKPVAAYQ